MEDGEDEIEIPISVIWHSKGRVGKGSWVGLYVDLLYPVKEFPTLDCFECSSGQRQVTMCNDEETIKESTPYEVG